MRDAHRRQKAALGVPAFSDFDQAGDEVGGARPRRRVADARTIGDARVGVGSEGAAALVIDQIVPEAQLPQRIVEGSS